MSRKEIVALKLQMGIDPSAQIAPGVLLAMWQQLKSECNGEKRDWRISDPYPQMTSTPFDV